MKPKTSKPLTQFEKTLGAIRSGELKPPSVSMGAKEIDYIAYQLATHRFNLKVLARGRLKFRTITFTQLKQYYGLKGRGAKDVLTQFDSIIENYEKEYNTQVNNPKN
jgi:hypothetical protein